MPQTKLVLPPQAKASKRIESPEPTPSFAAKMTSAKGGHVMSNNYQDDEEYDENEDEEDDEDEEGPCTNVNSNNRGQLQQQASNDNDNGSDNEEQEDIADYCKGGYHPVKIGTLLFICSWGIFQYLLKMAKNSKTF